MGSFDGGLSRSNNIFQDNDMLFERMAGTFNQILSPVAFGLFADVYHINSDWMMHRYDTGQVATSQNNTGHRFDHPELLDHFVIEKFSQQLATTMMHGGL